VAAPAGAAPSTLSDASVALPAASAGVALDSAGSGSAAGSGRFDPWVLSQAIRLARSAGLPRPAKVILVPGANSRGLLSQ